MSTSTKELQKHSAQYKMEIYCHPCMVAKKIAAMDS